jgi:DNA repair exonuclease SbcCD ATPase subunit
MDWTQTSTIIANITIIFGAIFAIFSWRLQLRNQKKYETCEEFLLMLSRIKTIAQSLPALLFNKSEFSKEIRFKRASDKIQEDLMLQTRAKELSNYIIVFFDLKEFEEKYRNFLSTLTDYQSYISQLLRKVENKEDIVQDDLSKNEEFSRKIDDTYNHIKKLLKPYISSGVILQRTILYFLLIAIVGLYCFTLGFEKGKETQEKATQEQSYKSNKKI